MRICLLGDTHFGVRNDSKAFHAYYEKFYDEMTEMVRKEPQKLDRIMSAHFVTKFLIDVL